MTLSLHALPTKDSTTQISYQGTAWDTERSSPAYFEERSENYSNGKRISAHSSFKSPQSKILGELTLDFLRNQCKLDYVYKDFRNGYEEGAIVEPTGIKTYFQDSTHSPRKEKSLQVPEPCIINGGLGEFIKMNWQNITNGKRIPFNMVVPARLDYYRFVVFVDKKYAIQDRETGGRHCQPIVIEPKNSMLAMLLPTIIMYYDVKTLRMARYQGIVNIADDKGRSLRVRVDYPGLGP